MEEKPSKELSETMSDYLQLLVKHDNSDLNILADALVHVRAHIPSSDYKIIKEHILGIADGNVDYAVENIEKTVIALKEVKGNEKNKYYME